jgi:thioredoxin-like negative regulator of GroEL
MDQFSAMDFQADRLRLVEECAVCFHTTWCPFCRDFLPGFEALEGTVPFRLALADISDESSPLWEDHSVEIVPTIIAFRAGRPFWRKDGIGGYGLDENDLVALRAAFSAKAPRD